MHVLWKFKEWWTFYKLLYLRIVCGNIHNIMIVDCKINID